MAVSYKDVVLSPARAGDTVAFTGTDQDERVTFANPHQYLFDVDLSLDGGNDRVTEQAFDILNARVSAGSGDDMVSLDNVGALTVHAGTGDDTLSLGSGDGPVDARGGAGDDRIDAYASSGAAVHGGAGDDWIRGGTGRDEILGGPGRDKLVGQDGPDVLRGGDGDDRIYAMSGRDRLWGDGGADKLSCGSGYDLAHLARVDRFRGCETTRLP
jgi:Ca2+-binding RTX toxin-like protein